MRDHFTATVDAADAHARLHADADWDDRPDPADVALPLPTTVAPTTYDDPWGTDTGPAPF